MFSPFEQNVKKGLKLRGAGPASLQSSCVTEVYLFSFQSPSSPAASLPSSSIEFRLSTSQIMRMKTGEIRVQWVFLLLGLVVLASARPKSGQCEHYKYTLELWTWTRRSTRTFES